MNGVTLEPGKVVINRGSPTVVEALERAEVEVIQVDFSESQRFAIAGLHCATLELVRDQLDSTRARRRESPAATGEGETHARW